MILEARQRSERGSGRLRTLLILGSLTGFGALALDAYLPALPEIGRDLAASATTTQLTLTSCLLGLATGQLLGGPVSDARGRRGPMLLGVTGFAAVSLLCALSPSVAALIALRFLQGIFAGVGAVIARAVVRDRYSGSEAAQIFSLLMVAMALAPTLAPILGAGVLQVASWRWIFVVLAMLGTAVLTAAVVGLPESLPPARRRAGGLTEMLRTFRLLLRDRELVSYCLAIGFVFGALFAYIGGSPFVLQELYGLSPLLYGLLFGLNAFGIVAASSVSSRLVRNMPPERLLTAGLVQCCAGGIALLVSVTLGLGVLAVIVSLFAVVSSVGIVTPNATALALAGHPDAAGSASALLGLFQVSIGAAAAPLVGVAGEANEWPMAIVIAVLATLALAQQPLMARLPRSPARPAGGRSTQPDA